MSQRRAGCAARPDGTAGWLAKNYGRAEGFSLSFCGTAAGSGRCSHCRTSAEVTHRLRRLSYKWPAQIRRHLMLLAPAAFMLGLGWYKTAGIFLLLSLMRRPMLGALYDSLLPD
jgi:hypothetical protein